MRTHISLFCVCVLHAAQQKIQRRLRSWLNFSNKKIYTSRIKALKEILTILLESPYRWWLIWTPMTLKSCVHPINLIVQYILWWCWVSVQERKTRKKNQILFECSRFYFLFMHLYITADVRYIYAFGCNLQFKCANTASRHWHLLLHTSLQRWASAQINFRRQINWYLWIRLTHVNKEN